MATLKNKDQIKIAIKEKYELAKKALANSSIIYNIKTTSMDKEYANVIKNIDNEYTDFQKSNNSYSILTSDELKKQKLQSELKKISNKFLYMIDLVINPKHLVALEEETIINNIYQNNIEITQKNINMLNDRVMYITNQ
jgi:hypothetical protein